MPTQRGAYLGGVEMSAYGQGDIASQLRVAVAENAAGCTH